MKIIRVHKCLYCYIRQWEFSKVLSAQVSWCMNSKKHIEDVNTIPDWCPLPDADEKCIWTPDGKINGQETYYTSCDMVDFLEGYDFCPKCGKRIECLPHEVKDENLFL